MMNLSAFWHVQHIFFSSSAYLVNTGTQFVITGTKSGCPPSVLTGFILIYLFYLSANCFQSDFCASKTN